VYVYNINSADYIHLRVQPDIRIGPEVIGDVAGVPTTLKDKLAAAMGVDVSHLRLMFRSVLVSSENATLLSYGVTDGTTMQLRVHKSPATGRCEVVLACAAKQSATEAEREKDEALCLRPYGLSSPAARKRLDDRFARNGVSLVPKWISQEKPKLFAPVGIGFDGHGGHNPFTEFASQGPWQSPSSESLGIQRVREAMAQVEIPLRSATGGA
jgi:hypothetical protein